MDSTLRVADTTTLRAWWAHLQGLGGRYEGATAAEVLERTGWARSVGGSGSYLGLFARAGLDRETVDDGVAKLAVHELPSARGCTYVLPSADFALGLTVGAGAPAGEVAAAVKHLGVTQVEIDRLCDAVLGALEDAAEPADPATLKTLVGDAARDLGEAGRKRSQSHTLGLALGLLQARGDIRRVPVDGRLDQQRFRYARWSPSPIVDALDGDSARTELARRYFSWASPASMRHFRWFSAFGAAAAKKAVEPLGLIPVEGTDLLVAPDLAAEFSAFQTPKKPSYALLTGIDGIHLLHRDLPRLVERSDADRQVPGGKPGKTLGDEPDPPTPIIVDRGRIVGLWEYDPEEGRIVYDLFTRPDAAARAAVSRTEEFVRDQLGDVRSFSLDSVKSRRPRIEALVSAQ